jgi:hypothetical protein
VISFTVETDGRLPDGTILSDAILAADAATGRSPATVRNVYVIGPDKKIKLVISYPMTTGRNACSWRDLSASQSDVLSGRRTTASPLSAAPRYPSNLISCSSRGLNGGLPASAGWQGRMKPGRLERDRSGRETGQTIRNQRVGKAGE